MWTLAFIFFAAARSQLLVIVFKAIVFQFLITEIMVLRSKRGSIRSQNCSLVHFNFFQKPFYRNLVAKVAKRVIFDAIFNAIFNLQFLIAFIQTCSFSSINVKILIQVLTIETKLNNFLLALIVATKLYSLPFRPTGSRSRTVIIFV